MTSAISNTLSRPTGTALFIEADRKTIMVRRRIRHHCTREEWRDPVRRQAKIDEAWRLAIASIRSEDEAFVSPSPVVLYRDPLTGKVVCADIRLPQDDGPRWINPDGTRILLSPIEIRLALAGLIREPTTYALWAEGPLPYLGSHEAALAPDPLGDRSLQRVRHQNAALRARIDAAIGDDDRALAVDAGHEEYVDFRIRGVFERSDLRTFNSAQTGEAAKLVLADGTIDIRDHDPADLTE